MLKVGLTGGIGCGKSTAADIFAQLGVPVLDADKIARDLVAPGQSALLHITQIFGTDILNADGTLNRPCLRERVFSDPAQKLKLEAILHPLIYNTLQIESAKLTAPYCILCIPLLFESGGTDFIDRIVVVDCPEASQIARVKQRDQLGDETIRAIMVSQSSRPYRIAHADDVLDNSGSNGKLAEQIKKLHNLYISLSHPLLEPTSP